jgi:hypothetical protein
MLTALLSVVGIAVHLSTCLVGTSAAVSAVELSAMFDLRTSLTTTNIAIISTWGTADPCANASRWHGVECETAPDRIV